MIKLIIFIVTFILLSLIGVLLFYVIKKKKSSNDTAQIAVATEQLTESTNQLQIAKQKETEAQTNAETATTALQRAREIQQQAEADAQAAAVALAAARDALSNAQSAEAQALAAQQEKLALEQATQAAQAKANADRATAEALNQKQQADAQAAEAIRVSQEAAAQALNNALLVLQNQAASANTALQDAKNQLSNLSSVQSVSTAQGASQAVSVLNQALTAINSDASVITIAQGVGQSMTAENQLLYNNDIANDLMNQLYSAAATVTVIQKQVTSMLQAMQTQVDSLTQTENATVQMQSLNSTLTSIIQKITQYYQAANTAYTSAQPLMSTSAANALLGTLTAAQQSIINLQQSAATTYQQLLTLAAKNNITDTTTTTTNAQIKSIADMLFNLATQINSVSQKQEQLLTEEANSAVLSTQTTQAVKDVLAATQQVQQIYLSMQQTAQSIALQVATAQTQTKSSALQITLSTAQSNLQTLQQYVNQISQQAYNAQTLLSSGLAAQDSSAQKAVQDAVAMASNSNTTIYTPASQQVVQIQNILKQVQLQENVATALTNLTTKLTTLLSTANSIHLLVVDPNNPNNPNTSNVAVATAQQAATQAASSTSFTTIDSLYQLAATASNTAASLNTSALGYKAALDYIYSSIQTDPLITNTASYNITNPSIKTTIQNTNTQNTAVYSAAKADLVLLQNNAQAAAVATQSIYNMRSTMCSQCYSSSTSTVYPSSCSAKQLYALDNRGNFYCITGGTIYIVPLSFTYKDIVTSYRTIVSGTVGNVLSSFNTQVNTALTPWSGWYPPGTLVQLNVISASAATATSPPTFQGVVPSGMQYNKQGNQIIFTSTTLAPAAGTVLGHNLGAIDLSKFSSSVLGTGVTWTTSNTPSILPIPTTNTPAVQKAGVEVTTGDVLAVYFTSPYPILRRPWSTLYSTTLANQTFCSCVTTTGEYSSSAYTTYNTLYPRCASTLCPTTPLYSDTHTIIDSGVTTAGATNLLSVSFDADGNEYFLATGNRLYKRDRNGVPMLLNSVLNGAPAGTTLQYVSTDGGSYTNGTLSLYGLGSNNRFYILNSSCIGTGGWTPTGSGWMPIQMYYGGTEYLGGALTPSPPMYFTYSGTLPAANFICFCVKY